MNIETIPIDDLTVDPANIRRHDERNAVGIESSLKRFGPGRSIVVDGKGIVRAGNGTVEAARRAGFTEVLIVDPQPGQLVAVRREDWSPTEATAYGIADNRLTDQSAFDETALAETLRALQSEAFDLDAVGFTADEVDELCEQLGTDLLGDEDEESEPAIDRAEELQAKWRTELGQLWVIPSRMMPGKEHRLLCGDSTKTEDVARVMDGKQADLLLTDPPYGVNACRMTLGLGKKEFHRGDWDRERPLISPFLSMASEAIVWGGNYFAHDLPVSNDWLCWHKKNDDRSFSEFELAWSNLGLNCRHLSHHWSGEDKGHPTQKPLLVIVWCLELAAKAKLVFDPFLGSGTTIVAAEQAGRLCYGLEIAPKYVAVILERLALLGLEPRLA